MTYDIFWHNLWCKLFSTSCKIKINEQNKIHHEFIPKSTFGKLIITRHIHITLSILGNRTNATKFVWSRKYETDVILRLLHQCLISPVTNPNTHYQRYLLVRSRMNMQKSTSRKNIEYQKKRKEKNNKQETQIWKFINVLSLSDALILLKYRNVLTEYPPSPKRDKQTEKMRSR